MEDLDPIPLPKPFLPPGSKSDIENVPTPSEGTSDGYVNIDIQEGEECTEVSQNPPHWQSTLETYDNITDPPVKSIGPKRKKPRKHRKVKSSEQSESSSEEQTQKRKHAKLSGVKQEKKNERGVQNHTDFKRVAKSEREEDSKSEVSVNLESSYRSKDSVTVDSLENSSSIGLGLVNEEADCLLPHVSNHRQAINSTCTGKKELIGILNSTQEEVIIQYFSCIEKKQLWKPILSLAILLGVILVPTIVLMLLYEFKGHIFTDTSSSTHDTLALPGDYVLLPYHIKGYVMYYHMLYFNVLPTKVLYPVNIYSFPCDTLLEKTGEYKKIGVSPSSSSKSPSIPLLNRIYFGHCSKPRYDDKCVLDQYIYQAKSPVSELNYDIILDYFTAGVTDVRILVYDNAEYFIEYLKNGENSKAIKNFAMDGINSLFVFNDEEMRESSYYFIAIEDVEGSSEWFTVNHLGLHVYYNASAYTTLCVMNSSNNYSCEVEVTDENQCFLGHVKGERVNGVPTAEQQIHILHRLSNPMSTNKGRGIILGGCFSPVILIALFCWCVCNCRLVLKGRCKRKSDDQDDKLREI